METDFTSMEINELRKMLRKSDLTIEERKYFLKRKDLLEKEIDWEGEMKKLLELKRLKKTEFYNFCIVCDRRLHSTTKPINHKGVNVMELKFCCSCFKKFEGKTLNQLPDRVFNKIRRKLKKYNKSRKNG